jgi:osmotically-inducible protein OsmY
VNREDPLDGWDYKVDAQASGSVWPEGLKELAERCLRGTSHLALKNISCVYRDGVFVLQGCVPTYYLKLVAQEVVRQLEGVERIDNQIQVVAPAVPPRRG